MEAIDSILSALHLTAFVADVKSFFLTATLARAGLWIGLTLAIAFGMESWAAFVHRVLWHRSLMVFHRSHHRLHTNRIEANDIFSVVHAPLAMGIIIGGILVGPGIVGDVLFGLGAGITLYGMLYFVFHDGMVHGRLPVGFLEKVPMFAKWKEAHHMHHKSGAYPYGFFRGPTELENVRRRQNAARGIPTA